MRDSHGREIDYLRVSVTDRCNLRCRYCMPQSGLALKTHEEVLSLEEIIRLVEVAVGLGLDRIRLTGGEPLVRKNFSYLVSQLGALPGIKDLSLTTNGTLLAGRAEELRRAGLNRVNISLDTLNRDKFSYLTRGGDLDKVRQGIEAALACGLEPVKINVVVSRGFNEDEVEALAGLSREQPLHIRFIEMMPMGQAAGSYGGFVPLGSVMDRLRQAILLEAVNVPGCGPASYYRLPGARGTVGFIAAMSRCFCAACNRLRLTADGKLRPCLESDWEVDLKPSLRAGASQAELASSFRLAVAAKPSHHRFGAGHRSSEDRDMWQIGG